MNQKRYNQRDKIDQLLGSDLDVDTAWNDFGKQKRRKRPFLFWMFGVLSILVLSVFIYTTIYPPIEVGNSENDSDIMADNNSTDTDGNISLSQEEAISDENLTNIKADYNSTNADGHISLTQEEPILNKNITTVKADYNSTISNGKISLNQEDTNSNNNQGEKFSKQDINQTVNKNDQIVRLSDNTTNRIINANKAKGKTELKDLATNTYQNTPQGKQTNITNNNKGENGETNLDNEQKLPFSEMTSLSTNLEKEIAKSESNQPTRTLAHTKLKYSLLPLIQLSELKYDSKSQLSILPQASAANTKLDQKSKYSLSLYSGIGTFTRSLSFSEDNMLQQRRLDNVKPLLSHSIGIGINLELTDKIYLESGLSYTNNISRIRDIIQQTVSSQQADDILIAFQIRDGVSQNIFGTATVDNIEVVEKTRFQQYKSLSIPITLSYAQPINNRFRVEFGVGLQYALLQSVVGETYNSVESIGEYRPVTDYGYKTSNHFEFRTHVGLRSYISKHIELGVRTTLLSDIQSRTSSLSDFEDRFNSYNISVHMTTHF